MGAVWGDRLTKILAHSNFTCFALFTSDVIQGMISGMGMINLLHSKYMSYRYQPVVKLTSWRVRDYHTQKYASFRLSLQILLQTCDNDICLGCQVCELTWYVTYSSTTCLKRPLKNRQIKDHNHKW